MLYHWAIETTVSEVYYEVHMTHVLHTARVSNVSSIMFVNRLREKSGVKFLSAEVWFLMGTQIFFFVSHSWQDEKHLSQRSSSIFLTQWIDSNQEWL